VRAAAATSVELGLVYYEEFSSGLVFALRPKVLHGYYHAPEGSIFALTRRLDWRYSLNADVQFRAYRTFGLTPYANWTFERQESVSDVFEFVRIRYKVGVSRSF
jgi:hypothetical protein